MINIKRQTGIVLLLLIMVFYAGLPAYAVSSTTTYAVLYLDRTEAYVNEMKVTLEAPATAVDGKTFVPAKFLGDTFGFPVSWNQQSQSVEMDIGGFQAVLDQARGTASYGGMVIPLNDVAIMRDNHLLVRLTWVMGLLRAQYTYDSKLKRIDIMFVQRPTGIYDELTGFSPPVAKFALGKAQYRIGEPIKYLDLSYSPDGERIDESRWEGKADAFFKPGTYPVSLKVKDRRGNWSKTYTRNVTVSSEIYLDREQYPMYVQPAGSIVPLDRDRLEAYKKVPDLSKTAVNDASRTLMVSDSPETILQKGILYQDSVMGKIRLYAHHINGTDQKLKFVIWVTNNGSQDVELRTTNAGEVYPSAYANIIGHQATIDFMTSDSVDEKLKVPAGKTLVYRVMPDYYPGQGMNVFYDLETDGRVTFTFAAVDPQAEELSGYAQLPYDRHVRGTFGVSEIRWNINASTFDTPSKLVIGDGVSDPFVNGYDFQQGVERRDNGNYGVMYKIHAEQPRRMAILLMARGGIYKGPIKINGELVMVPQSGVLTPVDGLYLLWRTTGREPSLDIEFTPSAGSSLPINLMFYPLKELK
ncbi:copper amine oxidase N-terminal domain-containing protein [Ferviditalea candida]|uniref:Copper amine oxidase N-terminal domain-containing protein n=1 Tax=Ferviditalea candida TaxID=3108399 RepID=A0ABU5ZKZ2_9BACL|nr:copper amine oxidase N-terminal domain-containing protein [Paenibacillaceae bacterium T2]